MVVAETLSQNRGGETIRPTASERGVPFNLRVSRSRKEPESAWIVGSYPFIQRDDGSVEKMRGSFYPAEDREEFLETDD